MVSAKQLENHDPASDFKPGHTIGDRFRVERLIAAGGMGFVYKATDLTQQQYVALKVMRTTLQRDPVAIERFRREVRTIKRLMHPNTIELIDYGVTEEGYMFLIMEWLHGKDLREILRQKKRLSPITAARVAIQVAWSLSEAHIKGIIHRDLKPENIFVLHNPGPHLRIKVVDFGLAKAVAGPESHEQITRGGVVCGTPEYMSPEQAKGEQLDGRSDVYALGCVLYAMLHGDAPFRGKKALDVAMMHVQDPFPTMDPRIPEGLRNIISRAVAKKTADRFPNVMAFADALEKFLEPIECRKREGNDGWTVKKSVPPSDENDTVVDASEKASVAERVSSGSIRIKAKDHASRPSACIRLATQPSVTSKRFNDLASAAKNAGDEKNTDADSDKKPKFGRFVKRCLGGLFSKDED